MVIIMANKANSLAHTKWMCKYHIIFTPKYRRKVIYNQYRKDLGEILRELCRNNRRTSDERPCTYASYDTSIIICICIYGISKGKSALMMFDRHANLKYKFGNRHFWSEGYYVSTVGLNDATVAKYIHEQEMHDIAMDKMSVNDTQIHSQKQSNRHINKKKQRERNSKKQSPLMAGESQKR